MAEATRQRCAVYTRKSTDEGLDQSFNSLDAQREACAAYVMSQQHEGWTLLPDFYDDGGYSGGTMDRPGLRQLLADVKSGRVDVVVVYKIDRLTRSLADFAKIVEVLDEAGASFVSVTQAFNTTTSMGRLTLNVLLSFAQFEREVAAERIRDKVAASKKRGMWMGGPVPLGYLVENRKLLVEPAEAATVREIMQRYTRSGSVRELLHELRRDGIVSKRRVSKNGRVTGGVPFGRGALYALLANRIYLGKIVHKGTAYPGEHEAIVEPELFEAVQARLAERTNPRSPRCSRRRQSLLTGMIFDRASRPMSPMHTRNHGRRYRYYASNTSNDDSKPAQRLPAGELEIAVGTAISSWLETPTKVRSLAPRASTVEVAALAERCAALGQRLSDAPPADAHELLKLLRTRVVVDEGVRLSFDCSSIVEQLDIRSETIGRIELTLDTYWTSCGHEPRLRLDPPAGHQSARDDRLIELITRAFAARATLLELSADDVAAMPPTRLRHLERVAKLSYLDPIIVTAILEGDQPCSLSARALSRMGGMPIDWAGQRRALGVTTAS